MDEEVKTNSKAVVALVLGILSLVVPYIGLVLGIIGLIYANKSLEEIEQTKESGIGLAIAGKVTSIIGIVLYGILIILLLFSFAIISEFYLGGFI